MGGKAKHASGSGRRSSALRFVVPVLVALAFEVLVFNARFWLGLVGIGEQTPFAFIPLRLVVELAAAYYASVFWPTSRIYETRLGESRWHLAVIAVLVAVHIASFAVITQHVDENQYFTAGTTKFEGAVYDDGQQYAYLADSIIAGRTWLDLQVPEWLAAMDNPYDANERFEHAYETGEPFYWDFAFYDGHYYCYFGALPALVAYVPFKLLTGHDLRTDYATAFFAAVLAVAIALFLYKFIRRYFPGMSLGVYMLAFIMCAMGTGILTQVFYPLFYSLPPLAGLACIFFGFTAWVSAKRDDGSLSKPLLVLGSVLVACTLECRPQMFLAMFVAIPLFWGEIVHERLFFSRKGWGNTACVIVPCLAIAGVAMWYNYVRFGSLFDFGASYNLTGFDMTVKGHGINKHALLISLLFYIAMPLDIKAQFPYLDQIDWRSEVPVEPFYGGFFAFTPAALSILGLWTVRKQLAERHLLGVSLLCLAITLVLMVVSAQVASVSMRYFSDFAWALLIPALCVWFAWFERAEGSRRKFVALIAVFAVLVLAGEALSYWNLLSVGRYGEVIWMNPNFYALMESWFAL